MFWKSFAYAVASSLPCADIEHHALDTLPDRTLNMDIEGTVSKLVTSNQGLKLTWIRKVKRLYNSHV